MGFLKKFYLKHMVHWRCDNCDAELNIQKNFSTKTNRWECTYCSYNNDVSYVNVGKGNKLDRSYLDIREKIECKFDGLISYDKFIFFADSIAKQIKRLEVKVDGTFITGTVSTVSGIDTWDFKIDFNDFGDITGKYWWVYCENHDSFIPDGFIKKMVKLIKEEHESSLYKNGESANEVNNDVVRMIEKQLETFNEEQKIMLHKIIETVIKYPGMEDFDQFFTRVSGYDVGKGRIIMEVYKTLNEIQKLALIKHVKNIVKKRDDDNQK